MKHVLFFSLTILALIVATSLKAQTNDCNATGSQLTVGNYCLEIPFNSTNNTDYWNSASGCNSGDFDDAWGYFVATSTMTTIVYTSTNDAILTLFGATCSTTMTALACADNGTSGAETITFATTIGNTYNVRIQRFASNANMTGTICVLNTPTNEDPCTAALLANGTPGTLTGTTSGATNSAVADQLCDTYTNPNGDVWYRLLTDNDGTSGETLTITVTPSGGQDFAVYLYDGPDCNTLTYLDCADPGVGGDIEVLSYVVPDDIQGGGVEERAAHEFWIRVKQWSTPTGTFTITANNAALPIELTSFTGKVLDHSNLLQWTTATERNVQSHNIERSLNGINNWTLVGQTASKGDAQTAQSYSLEDRAPLTQSYYRLRTVDNDGQEQLSQVITLTRKDARFGILSAFPNPATESIAVQFNTNEEGTVTARITDVTGRLVAQQQMGAEKGINMLPIQLGQLSAGTYFVTLQNGSNITEPVRFVKQ